MIVRQASAAQLDLVFHSLDHEHRLGLLEMVGEHEAFQLSARSKESPSYLWDVLLVAGVEVCRQ